MKKIFIAVVISTFCLTVQAEITNISDAINKSGRQRMLSQRILKAYSMIGLNINSIEAKKQLDESISTFDEQLKDLINFAPNSEIRAELELVTSIWANYKKRVTKKVNKQIASELLIESKKLLDASHNVVLMLTELSDDNTGHLVNISGRQRMLSQRMTLLFMYQTWGYENDYITSTLAQDKDEFNRVLTELVTALENTQNLDKQLKKATREWNLFRHGLEGKDKTPIPFIVNMTGDMLLNRMNTVTGLYAEL